MATIISLYKTIKSKLTSLAIKSGNLILSTDSQELFFDQDGVRIKVSDIIYLNTEDDRIGILVPLNKFYYVKSTQKLWYHDTDWRLINESATIKSIVISPTTGSDQEITIDTDGTALIPSAGVNKLGVIKVGNNLSVQEDGTLSSVDVQHVFKITGTTPSSVVNNSIYVNKDGKASIADNSGVLTDLSVAVVNNLDNPNNNDIPSTLAVKNYVDSSKAWKLETLSLGSGPVGNYTPSNASVYYQLFNGHKEFKMYIDGVLTIPCNVVYKSDNNITALEAWYSGDGPTDLITVKLYSRDVITE